MNYKGVLFFLGVYSFLISIFSLINILYSVYFEFYLDLNSYFFLFFISLFFGLSLCFVGSKNRKNISVYDQLILIVVSFFFLPALICIPFFLSSHNFGLVDSYFEAMSGFTSTGFSMIENISFINESLLIWRSSSQWIGGAFFLISIMSTLGIKKIRIKPLYLIEGSYESGNFYNSFFKNSSKIFFMYSLSTLIIFILYIFVDIRFYDAFNLALTVVSAGGFLPKEQLSSIINNDFQVFILSVTLILPILNIYLICNVLFRQFKFERHLEDFHLIFLIIFLVLLFFFLAPNESFANILLMIVSSLSTSGISFDRSNSDLSLFLIFLTIIGGSVASTSSGFKYLRIYIILKNSIQEILRLSKPMYVFNKTLFRSKYTISEDDIKISFLIFILFVLCIFVLASILTLDSVTFENAYKLSILTLTNTTASNMFDINGFEFYHLRNTSKIFLVFFMILGKLELIAFLMLIKKFILRE